MSPDHALAALRAENPLVHCITNYVAMNISANVLLAAGASPAMIHAIEEVCDFVPVAGALTINIGTLSTSWIDSMMQAAQTANASGVPWVLDPVAHFATPYRAQVAQDLLVLRPSIVRGNASEILAFSDQIGHGKGADSGDSVEHAAEAARALAAKLNIVVAVSGVRDFVTDGTRSAWVSGGADLMPKVTALGCSLTALIGGYAAICPPLEAAIAGCAHFAVAGTRAAPQAVGPGSFEMDFIDALATTQPADLTDDGLVSWN